MCDCDKISKIKLGVEKSMGKNKTFMAKNQIDVGCCCEKLPCQ